LVGERVEESVVVLELVDAVVGEVEVVVGRGGECGDDEDPCDQEDEAHLLMIYDKKMSVLVCFHRSK